MLQEHKSVRRIACWLEYQLRYYDFPVFAAKVALELRLGLLFVPCNDGKNRSRGAAHAIGWCEITCELPDDRPIAIQELPAVWTGPHIQRISGRERSNGAVNRMTGGPVRGKAQKDVAQAETPILTGQFRSCRRKVAEWLARLYRWQAGKGCLELLISLKVAPGQESAARGSSPHNRACVEHRRPRHGLRGPSRRRARRRDRIPSLWRDERLTTTALAGGGALPVPTRPATR